MSELDEPVERHATDEPDGTPAFAASLRAPGESVGVGEQPDDAGRPEPETGGGYDAAAVSGDSEAYRPD